MEIISKIIASISWFHRCYVHTFVNHLQCLTTISPTKMIDNAANNPQYGLTSSLVDVQIVYHYQSLFTTLHHHHPFYKPRVSKNLFNLSLQGRKGERCAQGIFPESDEARLSRAGIPPQNFESIESRAWVMDLWGRVVPPRCK